MVTNSGQRASSKSRFRSSAETANTKVETLLANLGSINWKTQLTPETLGQLCNIGLRGESEVLAAITCELAIDCQPITLRGLFYRVVSTGYLPSTDAQHYKRVGRLVTQLRRKGLLPYAWIVDSMRSTNKPSSWTGLGDFGDTVREAYRKDFWHHLDDYVHIFVEKDAIAGTIAPVTREYDVALSPVRGYSSESFAYELGQQFRDIDKPIHAYYLGDFDPSGFDIERDLRSKLETQSGRYIEWQRLAINASDFDDHNLIPLEAKQKDKRYQKFVDEHGYKCAEVDALNPNVLRKRVSNAITMWIPRDRWESLKHVEQLERETFVAAMAGLEGGQ